MGQKGFFTKTEYGLLLLSALFLLAMVGVLYAASPQGDRADYAISTQAPGRDLLPETALPVNINTASAAQLETLPGIGPVLAERIIAYRLEHGPFQTEEDLTQVSGIGEATLEDLRGQIVIE